MTNNPRAVIDTKRKEALTRHSLIMFGDALRNEDERERTGDAAYMRDRDSLPRCHPWPARPPPRGAPTPDPVVMEGGEGGSTVGRLPATHPLRLQITLVVWSAPGPLVTAMSCCALRRPLERLKRESPSCDDTAHTVLCDCCCEPYL